MLKGSFIFTLIISFWILVISFAPLEKAPSSLNFLTGRADAELLKEQAQLKPQVQINQIEKDYISLPLPQLRSDTSVEEALAHRRSRRLYQEKSITLQQLAQILWAAQGITGQAGNYKLRAAPSAGALYPIELYVVLPKGVYHYLPQKHALEKIKHGDLRAELAHAAFGQWWIKQASCDIIITSVHERTMAKYGQRGIRYAIMEAGAVGENIYLQVESLGLGTVGVGAFGDKKVQEVLGIPKDRRPLYILPLGYHLEK